MTKTNRNSTVYEDTQTEMAVNIAQFLCKLS